MIATRPEEVEGLKKSGKILADSLQLVAQAVVPGISTASLDALARQAIVQRGGTPAFLGYLDFPAALCTSVNSKVVHGIPSEQEVLKEGDIIGLDLGVSHEGFITDMAVTVPVGTVSDTAQRLISTTRSALQAGLDVLKAGITTGDLGAAIEKAATTQGYTVVRDFIGHGVGASVHEEPQVPNFGEPGKGPTLQKGHVIAIEPMVNVGGSAVRVHEDLWTVETMDKRLSGHFEVTVLVTDGGFDYITVPFL